MNIIKYALFIAALSLPVTNTHALEWVDYDDAQYQTTQSADLSVVKMPVIKNDLCHSVKAGGSFDQERDRRRMMMRTTSYQTTTVMTP